MPNILKKSKNSNLLESVLRKLDSVIHGIVNFQLPQKGMKSSDTKNIDITRDIK